WWDDYAAHDAVPASGYLLETGEPLAPITSFTGDTSEYTTKEFFDREISGVWTRTWQVACRENDIAAVGDYLEYEIVGLSVLIVRDTPTSIRAFRNACRHRGTAVAAGHGNKSCFTCPFHGWTYNLDGSLRSIPAAWDFSHVTRDSSGLAPVRAETFDGWVFVNLDDGAAPLADFLSETVCRHLRARPSERMWKACHLGAVVHSNWKVMLEAFLEVYHTAQTHPTVAAWGADLQARYDSFGPHSRMIAPTMISGLLGGGQYSQQEIVEEAVAFSRSFHLSGDGTGTGSDFTIEVPQDVSAREFMAGTVRLQMLEHGVELGDVGDAELIDAVLYHIFPNLMPFRNPAGHYVYRCRPNGTDPETCIFEVMHLVPLGEHERPPDVPLRMLADRESFAGCPELGEVGFLLQQDVDNCAAVQKGLRVAREIVLAERQEANIVNFHQALAAAIAASPEAGTAARHDGRAEGRARNADTI